MDGWLDLYARHRVMYTKRPWIQVPLGQGFKMMQWQGGKRQGLPGKSLQACKTFSFLMGLALRTQYWPSIWGVSTQGALGMIPPRSWWGIGIIPVRSPLGMLKGWWQRSGKLSSCQLTREGEIWTVEQALQTPRQMKIHHPTIHSINNSWTSTKYQMSF